MILTIDDKKLFVEKLGGKNSEFFQVGAKIDSDDVKDRLPYLVKLYERNKSNKDSKYKSKDDIKYREIIAFLRTVLIKNFNVSLETIETINPNTKNKLPERKYVYKVISKESKNNDNVLKLCTYCLEHADNTSKGVKIICDYLTRMKKDHRHEFTYEDCKDKSLLPFDTWLKIGSKDVVIEFDGKQHFEYPNIFHKTPQEYNSQIDRDNIKNRYCSKNKIAMIRISYEQERNIPSILETAFSKIKGADYHEIMLYDSNTYKSIRKIKVDEGWGCIMM